jgi:pimeloyl-ACP methyl ester carboxylesterase
MAEQFAHVGDIDICFETFGDPGDPAMLLIMGLGTQMVAWHDDFCEDLARRGFFVIRHDNRDIGRSTHLSRSKAPSLLKLARRDRHPAYTLADMAGDSVGVLDQLGIDKAHVVGASMGGMIAQTIAIRYPHRILSLVSLFSNTGSFWTGQPALTMYAVLLRPAPKEREAFINRAVETFEKIGGKGYEPGVEDLRTIATRSYERGGDPAGPGRQLGAIVADRDRSALLRRITVPTTVIHGTDDRLVRPSGGKATHKAIPGSRMVWVKGMGHGLPRGAWPQILDAIEANTSRAAPPQITSARG